MDGWCSATKNGISVPRIFLPWSHVLISRNERRQRETHGPTACRDPKEHRLPKSPCQGRRAVGMRVEKDEKRSGREKCLDAAFPRRRHARWTKTSQQILSGVRVGTVFGLIECDVCVPQALRAHFAKMQPVFKNIRLTRDDLGPFIRRYAEERGIMATPQRMLVGSFRGDKILLATPLLRWHLDHGLEVTRVYQVIEYTPIPCFRRFGDAESTARCEGDVHPHKAIIADTMKLLRNSGYGKTITNVDRPRDVKYCTEKAASLMVNDRRFRQFDVVVDDAYEIAINKKTVTYALPVHVGFFVLQYAKTRMLQFYYDFINRYLERPLFQY